MTDPDDTIRLGPISADEILSPNARRRPVPRPEPRPEPEPARTDESAGADADPEQDRERDPDRESEPDRERDPEPGKAPPRRRSAGATRSTRSTGRRSKPREPQPALARPSGRVVLAAAAVLLAIGSLFVPHVRLVLRQSFTEMPQTYTSLAFTADPTIRGTVLSVPVTVQGTNTGLSTYQVKVWTVNGAGRVDGTTTARVPTVKGVSAAVVTLPIAADAAVVWVALNGTDHTIYYRIS